MPAPAITSVTVNGQSSNITLKEGGATNTIEITGTNFASTGATYSLTYSGLSFTCTQDPNSTSPTISSTFLCNGNASSGGNLGVVVGSNGEYTGTVTIYVVLIERPPLQ